VTTNTQAAPVLIDEEKGGMSFGEYIDIFFDVADTESLTEDAKEDALQKILKERGISEDRQRELANEMLQSWHNPQVKQPKAA
jgi:hypothetical protein